MSALATCRSARGAFSGTMLASAPVSITIRQTPGIPSAMKASSCFCVMPRRGTGASVAAAEASFSYSRSISSTIAGMVLPCLRSVRFFAAAECLAASLRTALRRRSHCSARLTVGGAVVGFKILGACSIGDANRRARFPLPDRSGMSLVRASLNDTLERTVELASAAGCAASPTLKFRKVRSPWSPGPRLGVHVRLSWLLRDPLSRRAASAAASSSRECRFLQPRGPRRNGQVPPRSHVCIGTPVCSRAG